jgi:hypothetical protein
MLIFAFLGVTRHAPSRHSTGTGCVALAIPLALRKKDSLPKPKGYLKSDEYQAYSGKPPGCMFWGPWYFPQGHWVLLERGKVGL